MGRPLPLVGCHQRQAITMRRQQQQRFILVLFIAVLCSVASVACGDKRQLLIIVDTDMPTPAQVARDPKFAAAATFDHARIRMQPEGETIRRTIDNDFYFQDILITPETPWPLSFGIEPGILASDDIARFSIVLYRQESLRALVLTRADEPVPELSVERLVRIDLPSGKETYRVVVHGDCLGTKADDTGLLTCVADPANLESPRNEVEHLADGAPVPATVSGSWTRGRASECDVPRPTKINAADAPCIGGSIGMRGDETFGAASQYATELYLNSAPKHLAYVHAFYMDRTEVSIARYREFVARVGVSAPLPTDTKLGSGCIWTTDPGNATDESRAVNCIDAASARKFCQEAGGDLPTDAEWEHAARSRGARAPYVWGNQQAACCAARLAVLQGCAVVGGPLPVGSFIDPLACDGRSDVTLDGISDLAGNVSELTLDGAQGYNKCSLPESGIVDDPICDRANEEKVVRGGSWRTSFDGAKLAVRRIATTRDDVGFRCVYKGTVATP